MTGWPCRLYHIKQVHWVCQEMHFIIINRDRSCCFFAITLSWFCNSQWLEYYCNILWHQCKESHNNFCLLLTKTVNWPILLTSAGPIHGTGGCMAPAASVGNTSTSAVAAQHQSQGHGGNIGNMPNICDMVLSGVTSCNIYFWWLTYCVITWPPWQPWIITAVDISQ